MTASGYRSRSPAESPTLLLTRWIFLRALAAVYLVAFLSLRVQILALIGSHGILPAGEFLAIVQQRIGVERYWLVPTLAWLGAGDAALTAMCSAGVVLAIVLMAGIAPGVCLVALWVLYLSLVSVGRVFLGYQWDALLLETGFLALLVTPWGLRPGLGAERPAPALGFWLIRWLLFRLMLGSGVVKLLHDDPSAPTWRTLTALRYHYETQCLPPWTAWYAHQLPMWFHELSCAGMFAIELGVPFLIFGPRRARLVACVALIAFQLLILATGNYTFFNWLTIALCFVLLDDRMLARLVPAQLTRRLAGATPPRRPALLRTAMTLPIAIVIATASGLLMLQQVGGRAAMPAPGRQLLAWLEPFRSINSYGLFARMTTVRNEIVVEGSDDGVSWRAYEFRWKPGDVMRRPEFVAPHQPRLDWQMWFAALTPYRYNPDQWFARLLQRLLEGSPEVVELLASNPFPAAPPRYVRAVLYEYHFTDWTSAGDAWWRREPRGLYAPAVSLR